MPRVPPNSFLWEDDITDVIRAALEKCGSCCLDNEKEVETVTDAVYSALNRKFRIEKKP